MTFGRFFGRSRRRRGFDESVTAGRFLPVIARSTAAAFSREPAVRLASLSARSARRRHATISGAASPA
jgi:hypothetical protein